MPWKSPKKTERRKRILKDRPECFLDPKGVGAQPGRPRYFVCKQGKVTCDGLRAARRRAILNGEREFEDKAIRRAKLMGCQWSRHSVSKPRGKRRARAKAA